MPPAVTTVTSTGAGNARRTGDHDLGVALSLTIVAAVDAELHGRGVGQARAGDRHRRAARQPAPPTD